MLKRISETVQINLSLIKQVENIVSYNPLQYICEADDNQYLLAISINAMQESVLKKEIEFTAKEKPKKDGYELLQVYAHGMIQEHCFVLFRYSRDIKVDYKKKVGDEHIERINHLQLYNSKTKTPVFFATDFENQNEIEKNEDTKKIQVIVTKNMDNIENIDELICPNVIYNRFDLTGKEHILLEVNEFGLKSYLLVEIQNKVAILGSFLMPLSSEAIRAIAKFIFENYSKIYKICYRNILFPVAAYKKTGQRIIFLPNKMDDLRIELSAKSRYNLRREKRLLCEKYGNYSIEEYHEKEIPDEIVQTYFKFKEVTHKRNYHMSAKEYINTYEVSDAYVMRIDDRILAVLFSCEQCDITFFENFSYDISFSFYSIGSIMYDIYLEKLIEKRKKAVFLGSGDYTYKKKYGSISIEAYSGEIYRWKFMEKLKQLARKAYAFVIIRRCGLKR